MIVRHENTGRLSKALVANGFVFLSGLTAKDRSGGVREQTADIWRRSTIIWRSRAPTSRAW
jgi:hypothetical protein